MFLGFNPGQLPLINQEISGLLRCNVERFNNVIINCKLAENNYNFTINSVNTFTPYQQYGALLSIISKYSVWTLCKNTSFNYIEEWFTDQENRPLENEDNMSITLHIKDI